MNALLRHMTLPLIPLLCRAEAPVLRVRGGQAELHQTILDATKSPSSITFYSIDPGIPTDKHPDSFGFHGYKIVSKTTITDVLTYRELLNYIKTDFTPSDTDVNCIFTPTHGIRLSSDTQNIDLLFSYCCSLLKGYTTQKVFGPFYTSCQSEQRLNQTFQILGLPISKPYWQQ